MPELFRCGIQIIEDRAQAGAVVHSISSANRDHPKWSPSQDNVATDGDGTHLIQGGSGRQVKS